MSGGADDPIGLTEAAEIAGRAEVSLRRAAALGTLEATKIGTSWMTTRAAISAYMALVASREWQSVPQRVARPGGHARRAGRRRSPPAT